MTTIRDVARTAGVSISTVSLAFSAPQRVNPETAAKIFQAAELLRYTPDPVAQSLKSGDSKLIGVLVHHATDSFFGYILREFERMALDNGFMTIISDSHGNLENERKILANLVRLRVAGVVLSTCGRNSDSFSHIAKLKIPVVLLDQDAKAVERDFVGTDNALMSSMLTEHLIELGHQRIAMLCGIPGFFTSEMRNRGFRQAMGKAGIPVDEELVVVADYDNRTAYEKTKALLTSPRPPTAILAANDQMAIGALEAINDLKISCPAKISLVGIDEPLWSSVIHPKITVATQPKNELAKAASDLLLNGIAEAKAGSWVAKRFIGTPRLVVGNSTGRVPIDGDDLPLRSLGC